MNKDKVFIISMPKSLTSSTTLFLEKYGYKTMHWVGEHTETSILKKNSTKFFIDFAKNYDVCSDPISFTF